MGRIPDPRRWRLSLGPALPSPGFRGRHERIPSHAPVAHAVLGKDVPKMALHAKYILQEIDTPTPERIPIHIDAGAAIGFITNTCSIGRMKHIDLRESWVEQLRKKGVIKWIKVPGTANRADTFTKVLQGAEFEKGTADLMVPLPTQGGMLE